MLMLQGWVAPWASAALKDAQHTHWLGAGLWHFRIMQSAVQVITWLVPALFIGWLMGNTRLAIGWRNAHAPLQYVLPVFMVLLALPMVQALSFNPDTFSLSPRFHAQESYIRAAEKAAEAVLLPMLSAKDATSLICNLFIFALLPAICEEAFFRGFLQRHLSRVMNIHAAVLLTGFIFSVIHFQFFGFFARWFLGVLLGYMLAGSGSLLPGIIAHFTFNGLQVVLLYLRGLYPASTPSDAYVSIPPLHTLAAGLGLCAMFFVFLQQIPPRKESL